MHLKKTLELLAAIALVSLTATATRAQSTNAKTNTVAAPLKPPAAACTNGWQSMLSAGLTLTRGNSDTLLATISAKTAKKCAANEIDLSLDATYGRATIKGVSSQTADQIHGALQYNRLFNERLYAYFRAEALHDEIADIGYRVTLAPGAGYYLIKTKKTELNIEAGPGVIIEKLDGERSSYATFRAGEKFKRELSDRARIWQSAEFLPQIDHPENYIVNAEIGIEADLSANKKMTLRSFLQDTYNNVPAVGREKNDAKLVTAIAYKF
jgi:putative salt-induced outer membrane protein